jgi:hypothetical protein
MLKVVDDDAGKEAVAMIHTPIYIPMTPLVIISSTTKHRNVLVSASTPQMVVPMT